MIEAKNLSMNYGATKALKNVSFKVEKGEIMGLVGPNGAGKSTAMNILTTQIIPTSGRASVGGYDILESPLEVRRLIGYLPETAPLYPEMEVCEYLEFTARARGMAPKKIEERKQWVVDKCGLKGVWRKLISSLSRGYRQRVGLAQALIHDPEVLVLDEPTSGLDPLQIIDIRRLIRNLATEKTIIFSTHILQEVSAIADRIVIINEGRIIADGTVNSLREQADRPVTTRVKLKCDDRKAKELLSKFEKDDYKIQWGEPENGWHEASIRTPAGADLKQELALAAHEAGVAVGQLSQEELTLEDIFISLVRQSRHND